MAHLLIEWHNLTVNHGPRYRPSCCWNLHF